jgi:hypothetical protein
MQSTAGQVFAGAIGDWISNFNQVWTVLGQITTQLEQQYTAMKATNDGNTDLAGRTVA